MISLCFRKIPSPPPAQPLCENESEIPVHTRGIQTCVGTPRRNPHLHGPARFICTSPSFSNSPSPQPGLREGSRVPSVFRPTARPRVVHLPHPSSHRAHHAIPPTCRASQPPQGLCTCCPRCPECSFPHVCLAHSLTSLRLLQKCHLFRKAFPDHPVYSSTTHSLSSPRPPLLQSTRHHSTCCMSYRGDCSVFSSSQ